MQTTEPRLRPPRLVDPGPLLRRWQVTSPAVQIPAVLLGLIVVAVVASTVGYVMAFRDFRLTWNSAGTNLRRSCFQRCAGLVTLVATTAAGRQRVEVQDVPLAEALRVAEAAVPGLLMPFLD